MSKIVLTMEKDGVIETLQFTTDPKGLVKAVQPLKRYNKENWNLVKCEGDNPRMVEFIKKQIVTYNANPEQYKASVRETLSVAKDMTGASTKDIIKAGKQAIKQKLRHPFKKAKLND